MLQAIRNIKPGWIIIFLGFIAGLSGLTMAEGKAGDRTFLCFDSGCIYVQGITNILIGFLCIGIGTFMILKK